MLYRGMYISAFIVVDTRAIPLATGDLLLLCPDGVWSLSIIAPASDPTQTAHALIQAALAGGGIDKVSALVVHVV